MLPEKSEPARPAEHEIGKFVCPETKAVVPLTAAVALTEIEWPLHVESCGACGGDHTLLSDDVWHPPIYGYE